MRFSNQGVYESILKSNEGKVSTSTEEIEKDLNRSLPEYAGYQTAEGIEVRTVFATIAALSVLTALARRCGGS